MTGEVTERVECEECHALVPIDNAWPATPHPDCAIVCYACGPQAHQVVELAHDAAILQDENRRLRAEAADMGERLVSAAVELGGARETIARLNRRAQAAEAGVHEATQHGVNPKGWSFGRMLANAAARMYHQRLDVAMGALEPLAKEVRHHTREGFCPNVEVCWSLCLVAAAAVDEIRKLEATLGPPV